MQITLAKTAGFCFGVNRAVNMLYDLVDKGISVCTLGPIIHNPQVIRDLENKGVNILDEICVQEPDLLITPALKGYIKQTIEDNL